jgi:hypothetical protein
MPKPGNHLLPHLIALAAAFALCRPGTTFRLGEEGRGVANSIPCGGSHFAGPRSAETSSGTKAVTLLTLSRSVDSAVHRRAICLLLHKRREPTNHLADSREFQMSPSYVYQYLATPPPQLPNRKLRPAFTTLLVSRMSTWLTGAMNETSRVPKL